jgi:hypothetical protein
MKVAAAHVGVAEIRMFEMGSAKASAVKVCTCESRTFQARAAQHGIVQVSTL